MVVVLGEEKNTKKQQSKFSGFGWGGQKFFIRFSAKYFSGRLLWLFWPKILHKSSISSQLLIQILHNILTNIVQTYPNIVVAAEVAKHVFTKVLPAVGFCWGLPPPAPMIFRKRTIGQILHWNIWYNIKVIFCIILKIWPKYWTCTLGKNLPQIWYNYHSNIFCFI